MGVQFHILWLGNGSPWQNQYHLLNTLPPLRQDLLATAPGFISVVKFFFFLYIFVCAVVMVLINLAPAQLSHFWDGCCDLVILLI